SEEGRASNGASDQVAVMDTVVHLVDSVGSVPIVDLAKEPAMFDVEDGELDDRIESICEEKEQRPSGPTQRGRGQKRWGSESDTIEMDLDKYNRASSNRSRHWREGPRKEQRRSSGGGNEQRGTHSPQPREGRGDRDGPRPPLFSMPQVTAVSSFVLQPIALKPPVRLQPPARQFSPERRGADGGGRTGSPPLSSNDNRKKAQQRTWNERSPSPELIYTGKRRFAEESDRRDERGGNGRPRSGSFDRENGRRDEMDMGRRDGGGGYGRHHSRSPERGHGRRDGRDDGRRNDRGGYGR
ncbi:hypothetical protein PMAYCL1PPCAC_09747, partial [Pristionchus mayeri]